MRLMRTMKYKIIDSHRTINSRTKKALALFFCDVKQLSLNDGYDQVDFCNWFEKEFAVKWFEVVVYDAAKVVGYLRCLRNPEKLEEWFIGDVHVADAYRHQGIASKMYEKAIATVEEFEAAEYIVASVHQENKNSIGLHEKMGFFDTKSPCMFPNFYFDEKETAYKKWLYQYFPVSDIDMAMDALLPIWQAYERKQRMENFEETSSKEKLHIILKQSVEEGTDSFQTIWCGNRLVGFDYDGNIFIQELPVTVPISGTTVPT